MADNQIRGLSTRTLALNDLIPTQSQAGTSDAGKNTISELKTTLALVKGDVGLGSVDNTSDVSKPVSTAQQTALDLKQNITNALQTVKVSISSAQILAMFSTPITIIAAPGAGKLISIDKAIFVYNFNTTAYNTNTTIALYDGAAREMQVASFLAGGSTLSVYLGQSISYAGISGVPASNQPATLYSVGGAPLAGNSTITVYVTYSIITL